MHNIKKRKKNFMYTISSHNCCLLSSNDVKKKKKHIRICQKSNPRQYTNQSCGEKLSSM
jgi:hypothetical protein